MVVPWRNGSVFDALMCNEMNCGVMVTSCRHKVVEGTYCLTCDAVYSETRRNPWNAVSMAAQSMALSCRLVEEFHNVWPSWVSRGGVIGILGGRLNCLPCMRLIPRRTLYKRLKASVLESWPITSAVNLIAEMYAPMLLCEWWGDR